MPEFSIIIPAYNVADFIGETLRSVISQDFSDWEALVVNDGSTDNTEKIIEQYCSVNEKIHLVSQKNGGLSAARNRGILCAAGKYFVFLDGDDRLYPGALEAYHKSVIFFNEPDIICGRGYVEFPDDRPEAEVYHAYVEIPEEIQTGHQAFSWIIRHRAVLVGSVWTRCYHRRLFQDGQLMFVPGRLHEDEEWAPRAFYRAKTVCFADTYSILYRIRIGSIMHGDASRKIACMVQNIQDMTAFLNGCVFERRQDAEPFIDDILFQYASFLIRMNYSFKDKAAALKLRKRRKISRLLSSSQYFSECSQLGCFLYFLVRNLEILPFLLPMAHGLIRITYKFKK